MDTNFCIAYCTVPNREVAEQIAKAIIHEALAACVNIIPGITAFYQWKGQLTEGSELLLMIKTHKKRLPLLEKKIIELHPYEFPEFITTSIIQGNQTYLDWVAEVVESSE